MTPTEKLRFVERDNQIGSMIATYRVLQQWYVYDINYPTEKGEWKDVPLEKEE